MPSTEVYLEWSICPICPLWIRLIQGTRSTYVLFEAYHGLSIKVLASQTTGNEQLLIYNCRIYNSADFLDSTDSGISPS